MSMPTYKAGQSGFSLIEALVGAVILAVVVVALTRLQVTMLADSGESRNTTHALNMANEKLEEMRSFSRNDLFHGLSAGNDTVNAQGAALSRSWTVTDQGGYLQASVIVNWTDSRGDAQSVELTSFINETDPVRSGKVLLGAVTTGGTGTGGTGTGGGTDAGTGTDTGTDAGTGTGTGTDTGTDTGTGTGTSAGTGTDTGTGTSEPPLVVTGEYSGCTASSPCAVSKGGTLNIAFKVGAGSELTASSAAGSDSDSMAWDSGTGVGNYSVSLPNGKGKTISVVITVKDASSESHSVTLKFVTQ